MKLRATMTIDFEVADFMEAAQEQQKLDAYAKDLSKTYDEVTLDLRERRDYKTKKTATATPATPSAKKARRKRAAKA